MLVAGVDQLEEQHGTLLGHRQVADLVGNQQRRKRDYSQAATQVIGGLRLGQRLDQSRQRAVVEAATALRVVAWFPGSRLRRSTARSRPGGGPRRRSVRRSSWRALARFPLPRTGRRLSRRLSTRACCTGSAAPASRRRSSPISPRARPAASITPAHHRPMRLSPNPRPPPLQPCPDCARGCTPSPLRLASRALRSPAPSRHAFLFAGSKSRHLDRDSCDSSALVPMSNPTTTGPILPQPSQSTPYSSYPQAENPHRLGQDRVAIVDHSGLAEVLEGHGAVSCSTSPATRTQWRPHRSQQSPVSWVRSLPERRSPSFVEVGGVAQPSQAPENPARFTSALVPPGSKGA